MTHIFPSQFSLERLITMTADLSNVVQIYNAIGDDRKEGNKN